LNLVKVKQSNDFEDGKCTESKLAMGYGLDLKKYDYPIRKISNC